METIPGVIFILNTTYSLPDSPSLSLSIPLTLPFNVFLTLVSLFFHTHTFAHRAERFPCLFFLIKIKRRRKPQSLIQSFFFSAQGHCFPNTLSQFLCWNIDKQNCETLSLLQFSKHMLLCARVCESVIVLARLRMCAYVCQKNK